jgi:hypothetical protein
MAGNRKPTRKAHRPKWNGAGVKLKTEPWKVAAIFNPLTAILDQLEQEGTIDVASNGTAIFKDHNDGCWYDSSVAIMGVVEAYEIHERRASRALDLGPLRQIANKLKYDMPITSDDTAAARACLVRMKAETIEMTSGYAKQLITDFQIMEEMQKAAA